MQDLEKFSALGLSPRTIAALIEKGFEEPTQIQAECIPLLLKEQADVVGQAQTGTGKTAAFGLPILEIVDPNSRAVQALILSPTRELAVQVAEEIDSLKGDRNLEIIPIYGGASMDLQLRRLRRGVQVVVGTPGRLLDHLRRGTLNLDSLKFVVLDEADEILNMGFIEDVEAILEKTPDDKRMLLFSATMPRQILTLAERFMKDYRLVKTKENALTENLTDQSYYEVREGDKLEALTRIIDIAPDFYGLVFCRTKMQSDDVGRQLVERGYEAEVIHGDLAQKQRELILQKMRDHRISILVATDVAARGIDIQDLTHVVNYTIPQNPDTYTHRVGRTGRAGKVGLAMTFVTPSEARRFTYLKRNIKNEIHKERLPDPQSVIEVKRARIISRIEETLKKDDHKQFVPMATALIEEHDGVQLLAAMLRQQYGNQLDERQYRQIALQDDTYGRARDDRYDRRDRPESRDFRDSRDSRDSREPSSYDDRRSENRYPSEKGSREFVRLFIAKGRTSGLTKRLLVDFIIENARVTDRELQEVEVLEDFSFVSAPYAAAQLILKAFSESSMEGKPLVTRARPDNPNGKNLSSRNVVRQDRERDSYAPRESHRPYRENRYREEAPPTHYETRDIAPERPAYKTKTDYGRPAPRDAEPRREGDFDRRDRYSYPSDRPAPSYGRPAVKSRIKPGAPSKFKKSRKSY